jgi:hypothetical protein
MNCIITDLSLTFLSCLNLLSVQLNFASIFQQNTIFSTNFSLPTPITILQKLLFLLFMIISSEPIASNKFLAFVFLIFLLHWIPLNILFFSNASRLGLVSQLLL